MHYSNALLSIFRGAYFVKPIYCAANEPDYCAAGDRIDFRIDDAGVGMDQNFREQVLQQVRAEIISGQSMPGSMYSVPTLAASLGVSSTPVREALLELARSGLIEPMRNRGFKVVEPTLTELRNLFDLREVLELHAAAIVVRKPKKISKNSFRSPMRSRARSRRKTSGSISRPIEPFTNC